MLRNPLTCIELWFLFQFLLLDVNCQMIPFKPKNRRDHTATYIDDKLYIFGGSHLSTDGNFFYHDFSVKFNTKNLSWQDLSNIKSVPPIHYGAASARGGENNNTLFLYGGVDYDPNMALVYTFDPQNEIWSVPEIKVPDISVNVPRKDLLTGIVDYNGKMYLWGGRSGSSANAPISRFIYGATIMSRSIIYTGGFRLDTGTLPLNEVFIYDTINNSWSTKTTSGKIPSARDEFSVVLGARFGINSVNKVDYDPLDGGDILLLDISNNDEYVWTNEFEPLLSSSTNTTYPSSKTATSPSPFNNSQQSNKSSLSATSIADAVAGTLFSGILLLLGCFFLYKWNHKRNKLLIPGSENREYIFTKGNNNSQKMAQLTINNNYNHHGKEVLQAPRNESTTNHELLTISELKDDILQTLKHDNNKKISLQNIDSEALQNLQNNGQASNSNIT
ncbi:5860_t:CDS:2, partial [Funneliformis caledonium]